MRRHRYRYTVLGPPTDWTCLRIAKRIRGAEEEYTAYASRDGQQWIPGGTWTDTLGRGARIGLVAFGGAGFTANFDYVRVYAVAAVNPLPAPRPPVPASSPPAMPTPNPLPPGR